MTTFTITFHFLHIHARMEIAQKNNQKSYQQNRHYLYYDNIVFSTRIRLVSFIERVPKFISFFTTSIQGQENIDQRRIQLTVRKLLTYWLIKLLSINYYRHTFHQELHLGGPKLPNSATDHLFEYRHPSPGNQNYFLPTRSGDLSDKAIRKCNSKRKQ